MLKSTDGIKLHTKNYLVDHAKASILLVHGLGEHAGRYQHVAKKFNEIGFNVYTFDLRGHGLSEGDRAFVKDISEYREDLETVYRSIPKKLPFYLLGHSMGGLITLSFMLFNEKTAVNGVIFSGAALEIGEDINAFTIAMIKTIARFAPKFKTVKLDPTVISSDPAEVEKYRTDPLNYLEGTKAGLALAMVNEIKDLQAKFKYLNAPVLIMHGGSDKLTNKKGSELLYEKSGSTDKTLKIWEGAFHEIFNEINQKEILDYTAQWLKERINA